jgi:hypothetical protein
MASAQGEDLGNRQRRPLRALFLASTFDAARVPPDDPVIDGSVEDGAEQPVCLCRGDGAQPRIEQLLAPAAHVRFGDFSDRPAVEVRRDVQPEPVTGEANRLRPEVGPFLDPRCAVVGEQLLA